MHATFRRDRKRLFKKFITVPPSDMTEEDSGFVEKRDDFLTQMLDHFMLTKYHKQDVCELETKVQELACREYRLARDIDNAANILLKLGACSCPEAPRESLEVRHQHLK